MKFKNGQRVKYPTLSFDVFLYIGLNPRCKGYAVVCRESNGAYFTARLDEIVDAGGPDNGKS